MKTTKMWLPLAILLMASGSAFAGKGVPVIAVGGGSYTQTKAYAGLAWTLGAKKNAAIPDLVVGVRSIKVKSNDSVSNGADLSARIGFASGLSFDSLRLSYVGGKREILGNVGVGYSFSNQSFFSTVAAQGAYSRIGLDYDFRSSKILPSLELISIDKPKKAKAGGLGCAIDNPDYYVPPGAGIGDSCFFSPG